MSSLTDSEYTLLAARQKRQNMLLATMPSYFKALVALSFLLYLISTWSNIIIVALQSIKNNDIGGSISKFLSSIIHTILSSLPSNLGVGGIITIVITLFSNIILWLFILWSLTFVPYLAFNSYKASKLYPSELTTKLSRWLQLMAATFFPMVVFAIAWSSLPYPASEATLQVHSIQEVLWIIGGVIVVIIILLASNQWIPTLIERRYGSRLLSLRMTIFSLLVYSSLFIAYGIGYNVASFATVLGILGYLMLSPEQLQSIGQEIVLYDIDPKIAERIQEIEHRYQELSLIEAENKLSRSELSALRKDSIARQEREGSKVERKLHEQLSSVRERRADLMQKVGEVHLGLLQQKLEMLEKMLEVTSAELNKKIDSEITKQIEELEGEAENLAPQELYQRIGRLITELDQALAGLPNAIEEITSQLQIATSTLEMQTQRMLEEHFSQQNTTQSAVIDEKETEQTDSDT